MPLFLYQKEFNYAAIKNFFIISKIWETCSSMSVMMCKIKQKSNTASDCYLHVTTSVEQ